LKILPFLCAFRLQTAHLLLIIFDMKILISFLALAGLLSSASTAFAQPPGSPLLDSYEKALADAEAAHQTQKAKLVEFYVNYLEDLARKSQQEGDLETLIVLKAEQQATREQGQPPGEPAGPVVETARTAFLSHAKKLEEELAGKKAALELTLLENLEQEISRLTREDQIEEARKLQEIQKELLAKQAPPTPTPSPKPKEKLGPNLFANGSFDDAPEGAWRVNAPGGRNKSGIYQEPNSGMNLVFRIEQSERANPSAYHAVPLKAGKTYRIRWRIRMLRPWRSGIELRGKGNYRMGFRIPGRVWNAWPEAEQMKHRHRIDFARQPPPDREWRWMQANLKVINKYQTEFYVNASRGEGDFLIDDIEIREILPPEKKKN